jgi:hypothetical protein
MIFEAESIAILRKFIYIKDSKLIREIFFGIKMNEYSFKVVEGGNSIELQH